MSVYLLNLRFDASHLADGNFDSSPAGNNLNRSLLWLKYGSNGLPADVVDSFAPVTHPLKEQDWSPVSVTTSALHLNNGDYLVVRMFPVVKPNTLSLKLTVVFGRGTTSPDVFTNLQSPFSDGGRALALLDNSSPAGVASTDGVAWTYCLGRVNADPNNGAEYAMNVGAVVSPTAGQVAIFASTIPIHTGGGGSRTKPFDAIEDLLSGGVAAVLGIVTFVVGALALWRAQRILAKANSLKK